MILTVILTNICSRFKLNPLCSPKRVKVNWIFSIFELEMELELIPNKGRYVPFRSMIFQMELVPFRSSQNWNSFHRSGTAVSFQCITEFRTHSRRWVYPVNSTQLNWTWDECIFSYSDVWTKCTLSYSVQLSWVCHSQKYTHNWVELKGWEWVHPYTQPKNDLK